jgi:hypothetical protein
MWGPYQIDCALYERARRQADALDQGALCYKAVDALYPVERVSNCIHVFGALAVGAPRLRFATPGWGESASYFITLNLAPWILDRCQTHEWVTERLGLGCYPIARRDLDHNPTRNPVLRESQNVLQRNVTRDGH